MLLQATRLIQCWKTGSKYVPVYFHCLDRGLLMMNLESNVVTFNIRLIITAA